MGGYLIDTVCILTTWNRPSLLRQSLPGIIRECQSVGAQLVIADDQSDNVETLNLIAGAEDRGAIVITRNYERLPEDNVDPHKGHVLTGRNNMFAFQWVLDKFPDAKYLIKVDDDTFHADGAFQKLFKAYDRAIVDGYKVIHVSGLATIFEPRLADHDGYSVIEKGCNATILYFREDWEIFLEEAHMGNIDIDGFDCHFMRMYWTKYKMDHVPIAVKPSYVYHTGFTGIHLGGHDINVDYPFDTSGLIVE